ncbi:MAG: 4-alpha-glucanotransferase, partial [Rikenellaceae bacterium]
MRITFNIHYITQGKELLTLNLVDGETVRTKKMKHLGNGEWSIQVTLTKSRIEYFYSVGKRREFSTRTLKVKNEDITLIVRDRWREMQSPKALYTSPFKSVFSENTTSITGVNKRVTIVVECPKVFKGEELAIVGSTSQLGEWDINKARYFQNFTYPFWHLSLNEGELQDGDQFKFVIISKDKVMWEEGENRVWSGGDIHNSSYSQISLSPPNYPNKQWRGKGIAIPLFSLRSKESAGIGDFDDLIKFSQWSSSIGCDVVQILPINDTTSTFTHKDSYPYSAISVFALHPLYLSIKSMGELEDKELSAQIFAKAGELNQIESLDYDQTSALKWQFFRAIYKQDGRSVLESRQYKQFYNKNKSWLVPYALFSYLRDLHSTIDYYRWGEWSHYDGKRAKEAISPNNPEFDKIAIYLFLQFHLDRQLTNARNEARKVGVALKGDIPIGVSRYSVETWTQPHLFNLDSQAGAPPDDFAINGQNWGFPTYNWKMMEKDGYLWWKNRFAKMNDYFELYRVDHILGFFRIWQIPSSSIEGLLGSFEPALPLSKNEISKHDFKVIEQKHLSPYIHIETLKKIFTADNEKMIDEFMIEVNGTKYYTLRAEFDTQQKIRHNLAITSREHLQPILFKIANDVLFVRDSTEPRKLHPRISAHNTIAYSENLTPSQQQIFDQIYNDFFYHRHNKFWADNALKKLPALVNSTPMLCCAEDLGMIPDSVPEVLNKLEIITLEVERMTKKAGEEFGKPSNYPYLSVCTTSTHDMSPIRLWWQEMEQSQRERYYNQILGFKGDAPKEATIEICKKIISNHLNSESILTILPLQDILSTNELTRVKNISDEQINVPSNPNHY